MKLCSFFLSFAFANVLSDHSKTDYIQDLFITNAHIELAYNMNNFTINDNVVLNGLEHVIKIIIESKEYLLVCTMLVVPEYLPWLFDWSVLRDFQKDIRDQIQLELNIPVPAFPVENLKNLVLEDVAVRRREHIGKPLKNMLNRIINYGKPENVTSLIEERRLYPSDTSENRISLALAGREMEISSEWTCLLIALFMSTKSPESFIKDIQFNSDGSCILKDDYKYSRPTYKTYKQIEGQWCQVIGDVIKPLNEIL